MRQWKTAVGAVAMLGLVAGCGPVDGTPDAGTDEKSLQCSTTNEYVAFDVANHASQDLRQQRIEEIAELFDPVADDPSIAGQQADAALEKYEAEDANLAAKVAGREDAHLTGDDAKVGGFIDANVRGAIEDLRSADTAVKVDLAKERLEKALGFHFLYLSVVHELYDPSRKHHDEAFGYLGTGATNAEAGRMGLAKVAAKVDARYGTTLEAELFTQLIDGACVLDTALTAAGTESIELADAPDYKAVVESIDTRLRKVIAFYIGGELKGVVSSQSDLDEAWVKATEAEGAFHALEKSMLANGGDEAQFAQALRTAIDAARTKVAAGDPWYDEFPAGDLIDQLETTFGITVQTE